MTAQHTTKSNNQKSRTQTHSRPEHSRTEQNGTEQNRTQNNNGLEQNSLNRFLVCATNALGVAQLHRGRGGALPRRRHRRPVRSYFVPTQQPRGTPLLHIYSCIYTAIYIYILYSCMVPSWCAVSLLADCWLLCVCGRVCCVVISSQREWYALTPDRSSD